ncbi:hypothetical protein Hamer_G000886 [Homarus americanus]|uniref:Uncharacterized protein n=1 Tax=Homarus americanus TaxID=6706 RepID=A0A8J5N2C9_HOMAM|nr:hypothetical protein Hamer_G000886 [Homarus americanus]
MRLLWWVLLAGLVMAAAGQAEQGRSSSKSTVIHLVSSPFRQVQSHRAHQERLEVLAELASMAVAASETDSRDPSVKPSEEASQGVLDAVEAVIASIKPQSEAETPAGTDSSSQGGTSAGAEGDADGDSEGDAAETGNETTRNDQASGTAEVSEAEDPPSSNTSTTTTNSPIEAAVADEGDQETSEEPDTKEPEEKKPLTKEEQKAVEKYNGVTDKLVHVVSESLKKKVDSLPVTLDEAALITLEEVDVEAEAEPEPEVPIPQPNDKGDKRRRKNNNNRNRNANKKTMQGSEDDDEVVEHNNKRKINSGEVEKTEKRKRKQKNKRKNKNNNAQKTEEGEEEGEVADESNDNNKRNRKKNKKGKKQQRKHNKNKRKKNKKNKTDEEEITREAKALEEDQETREESDAEVTAAEGRRKNQPKRNNKEGPMLPTQEEVQASNARVTGFTKLSRNGDVSVDLSGKNPKFEASVIVGPLTVQLANNSRALTRSEVSANLEAKISFRVRETRGREKLKLISLDMTKMTPSEVNVLHSGLELEPQLVTLVREQMVLAVDEERIGRIVSNEVETVLLKDNVIQNLEDHPSLKQ